MRRNAIPTNDQEEQDRDRALGALGLLRRQGIAFRVATEIMGTNPKTAKPYVNSALRKDKRGRYYATLYDRIPRRLNFFMADGSHPIVIRDSRTASRIAEYSNAVRTYLRTGEITALVQFSGKSFRSGGVVYRFITDRDVLDRLADAGSLSAIESLYYARMAS